jgi:hypothetical protein
MEDSCAAETQRAVADGHRQFVLAQGIKLDGQVFAAAFRSEDNCLAPRDPTGWAQRPDLSRREMRSDGRNSPEMRRFLKRV